MGSPRWQLYTGQIFSLSRWTMWVNGTVTIASSPICSRRAFSGAGRKLPSASFTGAPRRGMNRQEWQPKPSNTHWLAEDYAHVARLVEAFALPMILQASLNTVEGWMQGDSS